MQWPRAVQSACAAAFASPHWAPLESLGPSGPACPFLPCPALTCCAVLLLHVLCLLPSCPGLQEVTTPVGQYAYASPALLESRGLSEADRESTKVGPTADAAVVLCAPCLAPTYNVVPLGAECSGAESAKLLPSRPLRVWPCLMGCRVCMGTGLSGPKYDTRRAPCCTSV